MLIFFNYMLSTPFLNAPEITQTDKEWVSPLALINSRHSPWLCVPPWRTPSLLEEPSGWTSFAVLDPASGPPLQLLGQDSDSSWPPYSQTTSSCSDFCSAQRSQNSTLSPHCLLQEFQRTGFYCHSCRAFPCFESWTGTLLWHRYCFCFPPWHSHTFEDSLFSSLYLFPWQQVSILWVCL